MSIASSGMFRKVLTIAILAHSGVSAQAQDEIAGIWHGEIKIPGQPLAVKVVLTRADAGWTGTIDIPAQVDAGQNLVAIAAALENNSNVTIHRLPELNHLFQHARTGLIGEYGVIEETISPEVLDLIRDWILTVTQ